MSVLTKSSAGRIVGIDRSDPVLVLRAGTAIQDAAFPLVAALLDLLRVVPDRGHERSAADLRRAADRAGAAHVGDLPPEPPQLRLQLLLLPVGLHAPVRLRCARLASSRMIDMAVFVLSRLSMPCAEGLQACP